MAVAVVKLLLPSKTLYSDSAKSSSQYSMDSYFWRTPISFVSTRLWRGSLKLFGVVVGEEKRNLPDNSTVKTGKLITESETSSPNLQTKNNPLPWDLTAFVISKLITQSGSGLLRQKFPSLKIKPLDENLHRSFSSIDQLSV
jgi:hypothetical protein